MVRPTVAPFLDPVPWMPGATRSWCETNHSPHQMMKLRKWIRCTFAPLYVPTSYLTWYLIKSVRATLLLPSENLSSHLVIVLGRYEFRVIVQKPFTVRYSVTNTVYKVSLREPVLTHWRYFTRSYVPSRIEQSLECPSFLFLLSLVLGFIIWRVCIMSTCQTHLFPCQCFDHYWFELQLNR